MIQIFLNISCIKINAIFTKSTVNILNILLSNTGEYQDNLPIQRRDMDSKTLDVKNYHWWTALSENLRRAVYITR